MSIVTVQDIYIPNLEIHMRITSGEKMMFNQIKQSIHNIDYRWQIRQPFTTNQVENTTTVPQIHWPVVTDNQQ